MPWYLYALIAALTWGVYYPVIEKILEKVSPTSLFALSIIPAVIFAITHRKTLTQDYQTFLMSGWDFKLLILVATVASALASLMIWEAISKHNATHVSLIEISYPVFVALASIVILKQNHLNLATLVGGGLVLVGVGIIIYTNK